MHVHGQHGCPYFSVCPGTGVHCSTVEPPNKGHFGNRPLVLCSEVVPISEVHDFSIHFDFIFPNKLVNALKCIIRA